MVDEVVAVGREVGLDDGVDAVVVAGVDNGIAEDDESSRLGLGSRGAGGVGSSSSCTRYYTGCGQHEQQAAADELLLSPMPHFPFDLLVVWCVQH